VPHVRVVPVYVCMYVCTYIRVEHTRNHSLPLSVPPVFCTGGDNGMQYSHEPNPGVRGSCAFASKFISRRPQIRTDRPWFILAQLIVISLSSRTKGRFGNVLFAASFVPPQPRKDKREFRLIEVTTNYYNLPCYVYTSRYLENNRKQFCFFFIVTSLYCQLYCHIN